VDGVTLNVGSDPLRPAAEIEVQRFAELATGTGTHGRRLYRLTPSSLAAAASKGDAAFWAAGSSNGRVEPCPRRPTAAHGGRDPIAGAASPARTARRQFDIADGLQQCLEPQPHRGKAGPMALAVDESNVGMLKQRLEELGIQLLGEA